MKTLDDVLTLTRDRRRLPPAPSRRAIREGAGVSQAAIAQVVGVTRAAVVLWERGARFPRPANLRRYLEVLERLAREPLA